jgi:hypothetical protein
MNTKKTTEYKRLLDKRDKLLNLKTHILEYLPHEHKIYDSANNRYCTLLDAIRIFRSNNDIPSGSDAKERTEQLSHVDLLERHLGMGEYKQKRIRVGTVEKSMVKVCEILKG